MIFAASTVTDAGGVPLWVFILLTVLSIVGVGGFATFIRSLKNQAVRDSKLDELIEPDTGVMARLTAQDKQISAMGRQLADLQRSMEEVAKLRTDFHKHVEANERSRRALRREIARKQDRIAA